MHSSGERYEVMRLFIVAFLQVSGSAKCRHLAESSWH